MLAINKRDSNKTIQTTTIILALLALLLFANNSVAAAKQQLLRFPDVSQNYVVFSYASDLWIVDKSGGKATRLTSQKGEELHPKFSPDGKKVAFVAPYANGNQDIYVISIAGGTPKRVTYHSSFDRFIDWMPDSKQLLFVSDRESYRPRFNQLYKVSIAGGLPEKLPMPYVEMATVSPDGQGIIYSYLKDFQNQPDFNRETWKGYRGGRAPSLWYYHLKSKTSRKLTNNQAPESAPMWTDKGIYYLSERGGKTSNLWHLALDGDKQRRITDFNQYDVTRPSFGPSDIVFEHQGNLKLLSLVDESISQMNISITEDSYSLIPKSINLQDRVTSVSLSNDAKKVVVQARGEVFVIDVEHDIAKNYGLGSGSAERFPALSPGGDLLAYMSDVSGEYQLYVKNLNSDKVTKLTSFEKGYLYRPTWSPDSKKIVFIDYKQTLRVVNIKTKKTHKIASNLWRHNSELELFKPSWSFDSRWLAYAQDIDNRNRVISIYDSKNNKSHQITSGNYDDHTPVFDKTGHYLYFLSRRALNPVYSDIDFTWAYANSTVISVLPLQNDIRLPHKNYVVASEHRTSLDLHNIESRSGVIDLPAGNYYQLAMDDNKLVYLKGKRSGSGSRTITAYFYDLLTSKEEVLSKDVSNTFDVSNAMVLLQKQDEFFVVPLSKSVELDKSINTENLTMQYIRQQESQQIFNDAWRFERDFYYDPNLHGADWPAIKSKYEGMVKYVRTDSDLSFIIRELAGEVSGGHVWATAIPRKRYDSKYTGLLGIDFEMSNGMYRIKKIINAGSHRQDVRSPLSEPGVDVNEGDYILSVNGRVLTDFSSPWAAFEGLANSNVELMVNTRPKHKGGKAVIVKTLSNESKLRELAWVDKNRKKVEALSNGQLGYIYLPDTSQNGQNELMRQYRAQFHKKGLVIDERFNSGGALGDRLVELLNRKPLVYFSNRNGRDSPLPELSHYGPKALITNGWSYSGGDGFPLLFKQANVGPLIGEKTWGGLIGPAASMPFVSGGRIATPPQRVYLPSGKWAEPNGVEPNIEIENDPGLMMKGQDPQLEAAVQNVLERLSQYQAHNRPTFTSDVNLN